MEVNLQAMEEVHKQSGVIRVKRKKLHAIENRLDEIRKLYSVRIDKFYKDSSDPRFVLFTMDRGDTPYDGEQLASEVQTYVDQLCSRERDDDEDSSYDSDDDDAASGGGGGHRDVSRTASDTLGQEFAEYVSLPSPGYAARVEFGLKLGYTENHVRAALHKLGPNPGQNDLLAELIKLGAQTASRLGSECSSDGGDEGGEVDPAAPPSAAACHCPITDDVRLRPIVIDGSNVAMSHGNKVVFSCRGIRLCVDWFRSRGHKEITVFVPLWRKEASRPDSPITDQEILQELERDKVLVFTPSRHCNGKRIQCYDDRYVVKLAAETDGVIVSNDNYRDLLAESPEFRKVIEERLLMYSFVNDRFMPPDDPLGRTGPTLDKFLRCGSRRGTDPPPPPCPYGKKCTYGNKCKFHHPERGPLPHKSVTERLAENAQRHLQARVSDTCPPGKQLKGKSLSLPLQSSEGATKQVKKVPLSRTRSVATPELPTEAADAGCFRSPPPAFPAPPPTRLWAPPPAAAGPPADPDLGENLHRKLQRQLTLNPSCDPRLYHLQRQHQAVSRVMSCEGYQTPNAHQSVTRIASAPPAARPPPALPPSSASDPQLNLSAPPPVLPPSWPVPPPGPPFHPPPAFDLDEARQRLHYHLGSIFPDEQVRAALRYYPNETNPQKICAAILSMFPPK